MDVAAIAPWAVLAVALVAFLLIDLRFFAAGRQPTFGEGVRWSIGWLVLSLLVTLVVWPLRGGEDAVLYLTVYLIERSLSLDNLVVFLLLFAYLQVPVPLRSRLLFWGIVLALVVRGGAIAGGVALVERFHFVLYLLGVLLLVLAYRIFKGVDEAADPRSNLMIRAVRKLYPVTDDYHGHRWLVRAEGRRHVTPLFLALAGVVFADIAFAIDSIPAAFAITRDPFTIWMANVFALLGLRALFVLVEGLSARFRYLDTSIALVLALVAIKLLIEDFVKVGPIVSLGIVLGVFTAGILLSLLADRRDRRAEAGA